MKAPVELPSASTDCRIASFPAIADTHARLLILGSMPGVASLQALRYYGHPRNAFWPIMTSITAVPHDADYGVRIDGLLRARIALWDVVSLCQRNGSLDSAIDPASVAVNDFESFFAGHASIRHVFFNGSAAESFFRERVMPHQRLPKLELTRLPSTSPAHAGLPLATKLEQWNLELTAALAHADGGECQGGSE